jgi:hypothetical protein
MQGVCAEIGGAHVALRLSPVTPANDAADPHPQPLFDHVVQQLAPLGLAYVHVIEGSTGLVEQLPPEFRPRVAAPPASPGPTQDELMRPPARNRT